MLSKRRSKRWEKEHVGGSTGQQLPCTTRRLPIQVLARQPPRFALPLRLTGSSLAAKPAPHIRPQNICALHLPLQNLLLTSALKSSMHSSLFLHKRSQLTCAGEGIKYPQACASTHKRVHACVARCAGTCTDARTHTYRACTGTKALLFFIAKCFPPFLFHLQTNMARYRASPKENDIAQAATDVE